MGIVLQVLSSFGVFFFPRIKGLIGLLGFRLVGANRGSPVSACPAGFGSLQRYLNTGKDGKRHGKALKKTPDLSRGFQGF